VSERDKKYAVCGMGFSLLRTVPRGFSAVEGFERAREREKLIAVCVLWNDESISGERLVCTIFYQFYLQRVINIFHSASLFACDGFAADYIQWSCANIYSIR
jgi:hypothetical protein